MTNGVRQAVAPTYLLMCLVLGGSAQGIWGNMLLQLVGIGIIAWAALTSAEAPENRSARQLLWIAILALAIIAFQLIPLPGSVWPHLGGREGFADGYRVLGITTPALPLSLAPYASFATFVTLIPPIALLCAIVRLQAYRMSWLAIALLAGMFFGVLLGVLQAASADPRSSPWYLYARSSFGFATGFFANANHMGILLVVSLPFLAALLVKARGSGVQRYSAAIALVAGAAMVVVVGIVLNGSLASYGLSVPVLAASTLIVAPTKSALRRWITVVTAVLFLGAVTALALSPVGDRSLGTQGSINTRATMNATTAHAFVDFLPFGSGLGTFEQVYRLYEDHDRITTTYVNHAHNDYAEVALETGLPGILLLILFLAWWGVAVARAWRFSDGGPYAQAASIASAAILVHSTVDFPLRTAAISATFAMCLAMLIVRPAVRRASERPDLWPTRHVVLE